MSENDKEINTMKPWIKKTTLAGLITLSYSLTAFAVVDCNATDLSTKESIQCQIKTNSHAMVSERLKTTLASCKANLDDSQCKKEHPFHILKKQASIDALSQCISDTLIQCVGEKLAPCAACTSH